MKLSEERKKRKHISPSVVPIERLRDLETTLRGSSDLAGITRFLKLSYTARETARGELARLVSVVPNLRYIDLPEGFFKADASTEILRHEMQKKCPDLRKMTYTNGGEQVFELHIHDGLWSNLEVLELKHLDVETTALRLVLGSLPALRELKIVGMTRLDDETFQVSSSFPDFPPLQKVTLEDTPNITTEGLMAYLGHTVVQASLKTLALTNTGVIISGVHTILKIASALTHFSITQSIENSSQLSSTPALSSWSLRTLNWEITSPGPETPSGIRRIRAADACYSYLSSSLQSRTIPNLRKLYVRDPDFHKFLVHAKGAGKAPVYDEEEPPISSSQVLEIFAKGPDDLDWISSFAPRELSQTSPDFPGQRINASQVRAGQGPKWTGEARRSVIMLEGSNSFSRTLPLRVQGSGLAFETATADLQSRAADSPSLEQWPKPPADAGSRKQSGSDLWR